jgi:hypothetical protein
MSRRKLASVTKIISTIDMAHILLNGPAIHVIVALRFDKGREGFHRDTWYDGWAPWSASIIAS